MYYLNYDNENIFLEQNNKIILINYIKFYYFMKKLKEMNKVELNGLRLTTKNTLIIDLTSISSLINIFNGNNNIVDSYTKIKLNDLVINQEDDYALKNIINKYLASIFECKFEDIDIDYIKLFKVYSNLEIEDEKIFFKMIDSIISSDEFEEVIIFYKRSIINEFKLQNIEKINDKKVILFEICDKESKLEINDNILIFDKEITQLRVDELYDMIINKIPKCNVKNEDTYIYLINKILFYAINRKEVDLVKKYEKEINELTEILNKEFKLNFTDTSDYL